MMNAEIASEMMRSRSHTDNIGVERGRLPSTGFPLGWRRGFPTADMVPILYGSGGPIEAFLAAIPKSHSLGRRALSGASPDAHLLRLSYNEATRNLLSSRNLPYVQARIDLGIPVCGDDVARLRMNCMD